MVDDCWSTRVWQPSWLIVVLPINGMIQQVWRTVFPVLMVRSSGENDQRGASASGVEDIFKLTTTMWSCPMISLRVLIPCLLTTGRQLPCSRSGRSSGTTVRDFTGWVLDFAAASFCSKGLVRLDPPVSDFNKVPRAVRWRQPTEVVIRLLLPRVFSKFEGHDLVIYTLSALTNHMFDSIGHLVLTRWLYILAYPGWILPFYNQSTSTTTSFDVVNHHKH